MQFFIGSIFIMDKSFGIRFQYIAISQGGGFMAQAQVICKSVFKSGENTTKNQYTKIWIALINQMERNKSKGLSFTNRPL